MLLSVEKTGLACSSFFQGINYLKINLLQMRFSKRDIPYTQRTLFFVQR